MNSPMGSEAKQGMEALVPSRSLTLTIIMGSLVGAIFFSFFSFLSFFSLLGFSATSSAGFALDLSFQPGSNLSSMTRSGVGDLGLPRRSCSSRFRFLSLSRSSSRSLPRSLSRSASSSGFLFSFHRKPPLLFLGRSRSSCNRGDLLLWRSLRREYGDRDLDSFIFVQYFVVLCLNGLECRRVMIGTC